MDSDLLARWCVEHLGSGPAKELFRSGHLSAVMGLRLDDGREVVVKVRPDSPRLAACVEVQRRMFEAGYPCPEPLTGVERLGGDMATAERYVPGGAVLPGGKDASVAFAEAFVGLMELAPRPEEVGTLNPPPEWMDWNHCGEGLWPKPDLDGVAGAEWIDEAGRRARERLRADEGAAVIGHCDWLAGNVRWNEGELLVVHDWDSVAAESEAVLVGCAAALHSTVDPEELATVEETERFLVAYGRARGRELDENERRRAWAAGVWTRAFDAKCQHAMGQRITALSEGEARERLKRA
ncbi:phosphotransferase family protein [Kutzneria chonburiensis]|uniref:Phosphotransferase family protein n=1 Tax=Kutzneria chonburiensis TaxID=1483604 RepID=A0ABV6MT45_9PSEU|nr:phosphotransferase [Kutzneria chonburiensis]